MKQSLIILFTAAFLLSTAHRLPAPIQEIPETPAPTPAPTATTTPTPKPIQNESAEPKPKQAKPKPVESAAPVKHATPEPSKVSVTGTWRGHWENSRGESGGVTVTLTEGPGGTITGDAGPGRIENGRRTGNVITYTYHRWGRDYSTTFNLSAGGAVMTGEYKVTQGAKQIYTGKYDNFRKH